MVNIFTNCRIELGGCQAVICITHGKLLKALLNDVIGGRKVEKLGDNCVVEVEFHKDGNLEVLNTEGVTFK